MYLRACCDDFAKVYEKLPVHRGLKRHKVGYLTFLAFRTEPKFEMLQMAMFQNAEEI